MRADTLSKRVFDVVLTVLLIVLTLPLTAILWVAVIIADGRPAIFAQERLGRGGRTFTMYKFRTMHAGSDRDHRLRPDGSLDIVEDDPRVFGLGRWLRRTSLDELPELWNVLLGDMSLVGPRPDLPFQEQYYSERERLRLRARPGITGLAQVSGRNALSWRERLALDVEYVETRTLGLDVRILGRTVAVVLGRRGIHGNGDGS